MARTRSQLSPHGLGAGGAAGGRWSECVGLAGQSLAGQGAGPGTCQETELEVRQAELGSRQVSSGFSLRSQASS